VVSIHHAHIKETKQGNNPTDTKFNKQSNNKKKERAKYQHKGKFFEIHVHV
jgi:hypothetical protein